MEYHDDMYMQLIQPLEYIEVTVCISLVEAVPVKLNSRYDLLRKGME
jgi:hypothetical protein